jgi:hypothetical protein
MRNYIKKLTVVIGITIASCSSPDPDPTVILPPTTSSCTTLNQMVGIKMANAGTNPEYQTLVFPGSNLAPVNNIPLSPNRIFTYGGAYNPTTQEYALVSNNNVSGNAELTKINASGVQTVSVLTGYFAEPVYLNNELYFGNIETVSSVTSFKVFDKNLVLLKSLVVNANKVFTTSTTDNSRYIYYLSEPFLITYDKLNNTLASSDLGTGSNLMGLEYKNPTTLLAMKLAFAGGVNNTEMISLNITNPTAVSVTSLYNFGLFIHPELYSTVYNACNNKYYISESFAGTGLIEVDLNTNTKTVSSIGANRIIGLAFKN